MILEGLISASCFLGSSDACSASLAEYVKYHKLDIQAQTVEANIKKRYPSAHLTGTIVATAIHRQYNFMIYKGIWYNGDYLNTQNPINKIVFKYEF